MWTAGADPCPAGAGGIGEDDGDPGVTVVTNLGKGERCRDVALDLGLDIIELLRAGFGKDLKAGVEETVVTDEESLTNLETVTHSTAVNTCGVGCRNVFGVDDGGSTEGRCLS